MDCLDGKNSSQTKTLRIIRICPHSQKGRFDEDCGKINNTLI